MLYFAYGANLNKRGMKQRCPMAKPAGLAVLEGYKLCFKRYADIIPVPDSCVRGAVWEITPACLRALDAYEGPDYVKQTVTVDCDSQRLEALVYTMNGQGMIAPPDMAYYREIEVGYRDWSLDEALLRRARYDVLNVGRFGGSPARNAGSSAKDPAHTPRKRVLWDPAAQSSGRIDALIGGGPPQIKVPQVTAPQLKARRITPRPAKATPHK